MPTKRADGGTRRLDKVKPRAKVHYRDKLKTFYDSALSRHEIEGGCKYDLEKLLPR